MDEKEHIISSMILKAQEKMQSAKLLFANGIYDDSVSRAYYAAFHAVSAVLFLNGFSFSSHSQTIGAFNREFVRTEIFPAHFSKSLHFLFDKRESGDYDIDKSIDEKIATQCLKEAEDILSSIQSYLLSKK